MKKVGIMSMQRIYNYGSFLQAYGLKKILCSLDTNVHFVDYHPGDVLVKKNKNHRLAEKLYKVLFTLSLSAPLTAKLNYIKYKNNYSKKYYPLLGLTSNNNYKTDNLDLLVIGSDEVFNCIQSNSNVGFSPDLFGINSKAKRLISYAASFGNTTLYALDNYKVKYKVSKWLNNFDALSVRDKNSFNIAKEITSKNIIQNFDPVLIYDFVNQENIPTKNLPYKYIILYGYNGRFSKQECGKIRKYTREHNLKIVCIGGVQHYCDKFLDCAPLEVLAYFKNAEYIITDTFHGTIMSIINQKKFITFVRKSGYSNSSKLEDLLQKLNLTSRIINNLDDLEMKLSINIDYKKTQKIIEKERKRTIDYLTSQLKKV